MKIECLDCRKLIDLNECIIVQEEIANIFSTNDYIHKGVCEECYKKVLEERKKEDEK